MKKIDLFMFCAGISAVLFVLGLLFFVGIPYLALGFIWLMNQSWGGYGLWAIACVVCGLIVFSFAPPATE